jgi:translation initiation factor 3 subunit K
MSAKIEQLLSDCGRYDANILPDLQEHLDRQLQGDMYDLDANLALLKLYLLYPEEANVDVIERVLLKALMAFPATDFHLCMYQIPEKYHSQLKEVIQLAQWLEMAKFTKFWKDSENCKALEQAVGWQKAVQNFIAGVISSTYRSIKGDQLVELLNMEASGLEALIKASCLS